MRHGICFRTRQGLAAVAYSPTEELLSYTANGAISYAGRQDGPPALSEWTHGDWRVAVKPGQQEKQPVFIAFEKDDEQRASAYNLFNNNKEEGKGRIMPAYIPQVHAAPITHQCIYAAAQYQQLPVELLYAIMEREGGKVGTVKKNKDGTHDFGVFQINSRWLPMFARYGISKYDLIYNGCVSAQAGAYILKREILEAGDFWKGVGNYHSHTPKYHEPYKLGVWKSAVEIQRQITR